MKYLKDRGTREVNFSFVHVLVQSAVGLCSQFKSDECGTLLALCLLLEIYYFIITMSIFNHQEAHKKRLKMCFFPINFGSQSAQSCCFFQLNAGAFSSRSCGQGWTGWRVQRFHQLTGHLSTWRRLAHIPGSLQASGEAPRIDSLEPLNSTYHALQLPISWWKNILESLEDLGTELFRLNRPHSQWPFCSYSRHMFDPLDFSFYLLYVTTRVLESPWPILPPISQRYRSDHASFLVLSLSLHRQSTHTGILPPLQNVSSRGNS